MKRYLTDDEWDKVIVASSEFGKKLKILIHEFDDKFENDIKDEALTHLQNNWGSFFSSYYWSEDVIKDKS